MSVADDSEDEMFLIDFISIRASGETIKKAKVTFPAKNQYVIINGEQDYFDAYYVSDEGMSSDSLYHRIATPDFKFWVYPKDYKRFISLANHRHNVLMANRQKRNEVIKSDIYTPFNYDHIDEEIFRCFIANKTGMCEAIGTWEQFQKIEDQLSKICQEKGGKYCKSEAKTAKFAIIFDPHARTSSNVNVLKAKGHKVTTFEKALEYFSLTKMWNCENLAKFEKNHKKFMKDNYG